MTLSLSIILDQLRDLALECHVPDPAQCRFCRSALLRRDPGGMRTDLIHICRLSEAMRAEAAAPGMYYLCVRDRIRDEAETEQLLRGMVIVNENMDVERLLSRIQDLFNRISEWYLQMQQALIHEQSLQHILDLSEPVLENTVNISDSAFSLLACTRNLPTDDEMSLDLRKYGYHPETTLQKLREQHRFKTWEQAQEILINDSYVLSPYVLVNKVFRFRNTYFTHVVMVCDHHPLSAGLLELFSMFIDILAIYAERNWKDKNELRHNYDSFFFDLLRGSLTNPTDIQERIQYLGLRSEGPFRLLKLGVEPGMEAGLGRMGRELSGLLPGAQIVLYEQTVLAVVLLRRSGSLDIPLEDLNHFLSRHQAHGGCSDPFFSLAQLPKAHNQAALALKYSAALRGAALFTDAPPPPLSFFQDRLLHGLLGEEYNNQWIWQESVYYQGLELLYNYDQQHGSNNLQLLRCYLRNERKATETGQELHMHRNNIIYRIGRMEKMMQLDLNDHAVRLGLEMGFLLLEIHGFPQSAPTAAQPED